MPNRLDEIQHVTRQFCNPPFSNCEFVTYPYFECGSLKTNMSKLFLLQMVLGKIEELSSVAYRWFWFKLNLVNFTKDSFSIWFPINWSLFKTLFAAIALKMFTKANDNFNHHIYLSIKNKKYVCYIDTCPSFMSIPVSMTWKHVLIK